VAAKLGIIAGGGELPGRLVAACRAQARPTFVLSFNGVAAVESVTPDAWVDIGAIGRTFALLKEAGCADVVLAGPIKRPRLRDLKLDQRGRGLLGRLMTAWGGDNSLLSLIVGEFEREGFRVVGAEDVLGELVVPPGPLGRHVPDAAAAADIALAAKAIAALGALDVGQAAVAQQGRVLGIEAAEGTDALIARAALYRSEEGARPVLVKLQKPEQERRVDLPTIGIKTVAQCADAGFAGIAIEAHATLVMGKAEVVAEADRRGLFVVAIPPPAATAKP
jgi:DUF1009 family protein